MSSANSKAENRKPGSVRLVADGGGRGTGNIVGAAGAILIGGLAVLVMRFRYLPETFGCIFKYAFAPEALLGGGYGPLAHATGLTYRSMLAASGLTQTNLVQYAISSVSSDFIGNTFIAVCLFFFAFSSVIVWNLFGRTNCNYLFGKRSTPIYSVIAVIFIFCGTIMKSGFVWELQDLLNQLMVFPNVLALIALSGTVAAASRRK